MPTTIRLRPRPQAGPTLLAAALIVLLAGVATNSVDNETSGATTANTTSPAAIAPTSTERTGATRITIHVGDDTATAALADTPAARDFAAMLPVTIVTRDLFGQAKADQLPRNLAAGDTGRASDYAVGDLGYWSPTGDLAIFYADDGQSLPPPGLVRLGTVDGELNAVADAGNHSTMTIELAD
jgi:hypothetical protein